MGVVLVDPTDALTYTVSYAQMLVQREAKKVPRASMISEDSCFCCKDGGVLIECDNVAYVSYAARSHHDQTLLENTKAPCAAPKSTTPVPRGTFYASWHHRSVDCLGSAIPDKGLWRCPRHFCFKCSAPTTHCCRFCVAAYCEVCISRTTHLLYIYDIFRVETRAPDCGGSWTCASRSAQHDLHCVSPVHRAARRSRCAGLAPKCLLQGDHVVAITSKQRSDAILGVGATGC